MSVAAPDETRKLPVWRTVLRCTQLVHRHGLRLILVGLPVIVLGALLLQPSDAWTMGSPIMIERAEPVFAERLRFQLAILLQTIGWGVLIAVVSTATLVSVHRLILRDDRGPYRFLPYRIGIREGRFLLIMIAVWAPSVLYGGATDLALLGALLTVTFPADDGGLAALVGSYATLIALAVGSLCVSWLTTRLAVALPLAAIDTQSALRRAWTLTRGNGWRAFAVVAIVALPAITLFAGLTVLDGWFAEWEAQEPSSSDVLFAMREVRPAWWYRVYAMGAGFVVWCAMLFEAVALSLIYRTLAGADGDELAWPRGAPKASP